MKNGKTENESFSIFDAPDEIKTKKQKNGKGRLTVLTVSALILIFIIAGVIFVPKILPEKQEEKQNTGFNSFSVMNISKDTVKSVKITNKNGTFTFYPKKDIITNGDSGTSYDVLHWYAEEIAEEKVNTTNTESKITAATVVSAVRKITEKSASECGFNNPSVSAEVTTKDSKSYTLYIGDISPDGYGVYIKFKDSEKIYLAEESIIDSFVFTADDLCSTQEVGEE